MDGDGRRIISGRYRRRVAGVGGVTWPADRETGGVDCYEAGGYQQAGTGSGREGEVLDELYAPGLLIVWHFSISIGPSSRRSCACAADRGAQIIAPKARVSAIVKSAAGLLMISSHVERG